MNFKREYSRSSKVKSQRGGLVYSERSGDDRRREERSELALSSKPFY